MWRFRCKDRLPSMGKPTARNNSDWGCRGYSFHGYPFERAWSSHSDEKTVLNKGQNPKVKGLISSRSRNLETLSGGRELPILQPFSREPKGQVVASGTSNPGTKLPYVWRCIIHLRIQMKPGSHTLEAGSLNLFFSLILNFQSARI